MSQIASVGVGISTTGTRPAMLERAVDAWRHIGFDPLVIVDSERAGVAHTKNRCLASLEGLEHIFLADDDVYPLFLGSVTRYVTDPEPHLMLSWGSHRLLERKDGYATFRWPRGVLLYLHRSVVERVGGMRTEFGTGGHEHVEYSRRIHQAGLTRHMFADLDRNPREFWHAEDMPRPGETVRQFSARKRRHTTIKRTTADSKRIAELWDRYDGVTDYVDFR